MQKGGKKQESGLRCCHPSRVNDEDWIDPRQRLKIDLANFIHPKIVCYYSTKNCISTREVTSSCDIPDSIESNAHNLALDGGEMALALSPCQPRLFPNIFRGTVVIFFHGFLFYCGLIKMAWRVKRNFPWWLVVAMAKSY